MCYVDKIKFLFLMNLKGRLIQTKGEGGVLEVGQKIKFEKVPLLSSLLLALHLLHRVGN